jgi:hypothetical protein
MYVATCADGTVLSRSYSAFCAALDLLCGSTATLGHHATHGLEVLGRGSLPTERPRQPHRIPTSPGCRWFPTASPQTKRDYAVHHGTAGKMDRKPLTSANAGKNGQRSFAGLWFRADRTSEKRKVGGSTPPLTTMRYSHLTTVHVHIWL